MVWYSLKFYKWWCCYYYKNSVNSFFITEFHNFIRVFRITHSIPRRRHVPNWRWRCRSLNAFLWFVFCLGGLFSLHCSTWFPLDLFFSFSNLFFLYFTLLCTVIPPAAPRKVSLQLLSRAAAGTCELRGWAELRRKWFYQRLTAALLTRSPLPPCHDTISPFSEPLQPEPSSCEKLKQKREKNTICLLRFASHLFELFCRQTVFVRHW